MRELPPNTKTRGDDTLADLGVVVVVVVVVGCEESRYARDDMTRKRTISIAFTFILNDTKGGRERGRESGRRGRRRSVFSIIFFMIAGRLLRVSEMRAKCTYNL